jgi:hypothetical protein
VQAPVPVSHVAPVAVRHAGGALQTTGFVPVQTPTWQVSDCVQAFPSLHAVPSPAIGFEHSPVPGLHVPATWH